MAASESPPSSARKVVVHFRATGGAPILKQAKFKISGSDKFAKVIEFLCRHIGQETLILSGDTDGKAENVISTIVRSDYEDQSTVDMKKK